MTERSREAGLLSEYYFIKRLNEEGIPHEYIDAETFDIKIGNEQIEVKSATLMISQPIKGKKSGRYWRVGRFNFHTLERFDKIREENNWVAFILRHRKEHMLLGLTKIENIPRKAQIPITLIRNLNLIGLDEWKEQQAKNKQN